MRIFRNLLLFGGFILCLSACGSSGEETSVIPEKKIPMVGEGGGYRIRLRPRQHKGEPKNPVPDYQYQSLQMKRP